ncbi:hypothetical protein ACFL0T_06170 [Candidatus Omnitrophota bacterium]
MKLLRNCIVFILIYCLAGCSPFYDPIKETDTAFEIASGTNMNLILQTPLTSNKNQRGDQFITQLKNDLKDKDKIILPKGSEVRGLVKRVSRYAKFGDRAGMLLIFDQLVLPDGKKLPMSASLDTDKGYEVIRIKGKAARDLKILGGSALVGTLAGKNTLGKDGAQKGLVVGTAAGAGAIILANTKEVSLPQDTELIIKLDEKLIIPKK